MRVLSSLVLVTCLSLSACVTDPISDPEEIFGTCENKAGIDYRKTVDAHPSDAIYDPVIVNLAMTIDDAAWKTLEGIYEECIGKSRCEDLPLSAQSPSNCCTDTLRQEYVPCTVTFEGQTLDGHVRLKGNPSDWDDVDKDVFQFVVRFNYKDDKGRLLGQRRLNLEGRRHSSLVRNNAAMWVMRQMGLPASRVNWLKLTLNGAPYAVYENIEAVDKEFLERHFTDPEGNLYKHFLATELKTNESAANTSDLEALQTVFSEGEESVHQNLDCGADVNEWIRLAAAEAALPAADNFYSSSFNLYAYNPPNGGWVVIPWDLDDVMYDGAPWNTVLRTGSPSDLGHWWEMMATNPDWYDRFLSDVGEAQKLMEDLPDRIETWCCNADLRAAVDETRAHFSGLDSFDRGCITVMANAHCRARYLESVLDGGDGGDCDPEALEGTMTMSCSTVNTSSDN